MNTTDNYGAVFKKIREKRGLSLTQVVRGITSPATLSRWENGKGEMYFDKIVCLLQRLNIYLDEFVSIAQYSREDIVELRELLQQIQKAYVEENSAYLKELAQRQMQVYQLTNKEIDFFLVMTIFSCYKDLTGKSISNEQEQIRLSYIFRHVKVWNKYYIRAFGNCVTLLDNKQVFEVGAKIIDSLKEIPQDNLTQISEAVKAVLNAVIILLRRDVKLATDLLNKVRKSRIPVDLLYLKMQALFLQEVASYLENNSHSTDRMKKLTDMLHLLGYDEEANKWCQIFKMSIQKGHEQ